MKGQGCLLKTGFIVVTLGSRQQTSGFLYTDVICNSNGSMHTRSYNCINIIHSTDQLGRISASVFLSATRER